MKDIAVNQATGDLVIHCVARAQDRLLVTNANLDILAELKAFEPIQGKREMMRQNLSKFSTAILTNAIEVADDNVLIVGHHDGTVSFWKLELDTRSAPSAIQPA